MRQAGRWQVVVVAECARQARGQGSGKIKKKKNRLNRAMRRYDLAKNALDED